MYELVPDENGSNGATEDGLGLGELVILTPGQSRPLHEQRPTHHEHAQQSYGRGYGP